MGRSKAEAVDTLAASLASPCTNSTRDAGTRLNTSQLSKTIQFALQPFSTHPQYICIGIAMGRGVLLWVTNLRGCSGFSSFIGVPPRAAIESMVNNPRPPGVRLKAVHPTGTCHWREGHGITIPRGRNMRPVLDLGQLTSRPCPGQVWVSAMLC